MDAVRSPATREVEGEGEGEPNESGQQHQVAHGVPDEVKRSQAVQNEKLALEPKSYYSIVVEGGFAHIGDNNVFYNSDQERNTQKAVERLLESLRYANMNLRRSQISQAHADTFSWLLEPPVYSDNHLPSHKLRYDLVSRISNWLRGSIKSICLVGKPGCGKSTLMKYIATQERTRLALDSNMKAKVQILAHYFWLSGDPDQRTLKGLYANLLLQALSSNVTLVRLMLSRESQILDKRIFSDWSEEELYHLLVQCLPQMPPTCLFIDGLDEIGDDQQLSALTDLFKVITRLKNTKLWLSTRNEPRLRPITSGFTKETTLIMHDCTSGDIYRLANSQLLNALKHVYHTAITEEDLGRISTSIMRKAEGVFLWAVLVVASVVRGLQYGDDPEMLYQRVERSPLKLRQLYDQMWRNSPEEEQEIYRQELAEMSCLATRFPISLLQCTLIMRANLRQRVLLAHDDDDTLLPEIFGACCQQENRLHPRVAGLLMTVRKHDLPPGMPTEGHWPLTYEHEVHYKHRHASGCYFSHDDNKCFNCPFLVNNTHQPACAKGQPVDAVGIAVQYVHDTVVVPIHRSAAEYLYEMCHDQQDKKAQCCYRMDKQVIDSLAALWHLQCDCSLAEVEFPRLYDRYTSEEETMKLFNSWMELELRGTTIDGFYRYSSIHRHHIRGYGGSQNTVYQDFAGLAAFVGAYHIALKLAESLPRHMIHSYKGYLLICASRGIGGFQTASTDPNFATVRLMQGMFNKLIANHKMDLRRYYEIVTDFEGRLWDYKIYSYHRMPADEALIAILRLICSQEEPMPLSTSWLLDVLCKIISTRPVIHFATTKRYTQHRMDHLSKSFDIPLQTTFEKSIDVFLAIDPARMSSDLQRMVQLGQFDWPRRKLHLFERARVVAVMISSPPEVRNTGLETLFLRLPGSDLTVDEKAATLGLVTDRSNPEQVAAIYLSIATRLGLFEHESYRQYMKIYPRLVDILRDDSVLHLSHVEFAHELEADERLVHSALRRTKVSRLSRMNAAQASRTKEDLRQMEIEWSCVREYG